MRKVLFVCHGNVCRSVMAEFIFKKRIKDLNIDSHFVCDSCGVSSEESGNDIYYYAKRALDKYNVPYDRHYARKITRDDFNNFDDILAMDNYNIYRLEMFLSRSSDKIRLLNQKGIEDPWPCGDFDQTYEDILEGINNYLKENGYGTN